MYIRKRETKLISDLKKWYRFNICILFTGHTVLEFYTWFKNIFQKITPLEGLILINKNQCINEKILKAVQIYLSAYQ